MPYGGGSRLLLGGWDFVYLYMFCGFPSAD